jgi:hypothetical protein
VSVQDVIELTRAGLGDEVLVALVETSGEIYTLSPQQVVELKRAGVSERVIVVMLRQGRTSVTAPAPALLSAAAPGVSPELPFGAVWQAAGVPESVPPPAAPAIVSQVFVVPPVVPYPVFVPGWSPHVVQTRFARPIDRSGGFGRFINDGFRSGTPIGVWGPVAPHRARHGRR